MNKLAPIEFLRGFVATIVLVLLLGPLGLVLSIITGVLWMLGGTYGKAIRRFGIPPVICLYLFQNTNTYLGLIALLSGMAILHLGDGFPDHRPTTQDEGSWLGRLVERIMQPITQEQINWCGEITKWIIPILFQLSLIPYFLNA